MVVFQPPASDLNLASGMPNTSLTIWIHDRLPDGARAAAGGEQHDVLKERAAVIKWPDMDALDPMAWHLLTY